MLTTVKAYSFPDDPLIMSLIVPETDVIQIRNIDGLDPVKATVNTSPRGSRDGSSYKGSNVADRNIVLTLGLNPDWVIWTMSKLREHLNTYFMPKSYVRLVFESDEKTPVEIFGYVESNSQSQFSKDPEIQISVICPDPYFKSIDGINIEGQSNAAAIPIEYEGDIETGVIVHVQKAFGSPAVYPTNIVFTLQGGYYSVVAADTVSGHPVDAAHDLYISSKVGDKYIRRYTNAPGPSTYTNLLNDSLLVNGKWPIIGPDTDSVQVTSDAGVQDFMMSYSPLYGGL